MMTKTLKTYFVLFCLTMVTSIISCSKMCDEGYEGNRCDVEIRDRFVGNWNASDEPGSKIYTNTITKGTGILDLLVSSSFSDSIFYRSLKATAGSSTISIARQKPDTSHIEVEGTGTIDTDHKHISWNYNLFNTYDSPTVVTSYTGVWTKF